MEIIKTLDGSSTLSSTHFPNQLYHSDKGAIAEAKHVYIRFIKPNSSILEVGFGSGLNALLSLETKQNLKYTSIELYPIETQTVEQLSFFNQDLLALHLAPWNSTTQINPNFELTKLNLNIEDTCLLENSLNSTYDLVFFDAFSPEIVPLQWSEEVFKTIYSKLNPNAQLVTYSAKGVVKQALRNAGFTVKRDVGALGKHHMIVATKNPQEEL